jgi:lipopolysaccharide export system ATP-binding protein
VIQEIVRDLRDRGISILITDHQVRETLQITDRSYVVTKGKVLCHGTPEEVVRHPRARELYFGEGLELGRAAHPAPSPVAAPHFTPPRTKSTPLHTLLDDLG